jgi:hypothetical protein
MLGNAQTNTFRLEKKTCLDEQVSSLSLSLPPSSLPPFLFLKSSFLQFFSFFFFSPLQTQELAFQPNRNQSSFLTSLRARNTERQKQQRRMKPKKQLFSVALSTLSARTISDGITNEPTTYLESLHKKIKKKKKKKKKKKLIFCLLLWRLLVLVVR